MTKMRVVVASLMALGALATCGGVSFGRIVECPGTIRVKADNPPAPWQTPEYNNYTLLSFSHASMSCAAGSCSISCAYTMYPSCGPDVSISSFTFLIDHVKPGECQYGQSGRGFICK
jgi:hypothetical protein